MNTHLSSWETVDALDGALPAGRQAHLEHCASCQADLEALRMVMADVVLDADMPEPSPLFWDHFQARVQAAVLSDGLTPSHAPWWHVFLGQGAWRSWLTVGAVVAALVLVVTLDTRQGVWKDDAVTADTDLGAAGSAWSEVPAVDATQWQFVTSVLGTLERDEVREVLAPSPRAVDAAFESLSQEERQNFIRLLRAEMVEGVE